MGTVIHLVIELVFVVIELLTTKCIVIVDHSIIEMH